MYPAGQVVFPPTVNTYASLGFSRMAYHSAHVAMNHCGAEKFALAPTRADIGKQATVGYRPCCDAAADVALPPTYALGEFQHLKARGLALWEMYWPHDVLPRVILRKPIALWTNRGFGWRNRYLRQFRTHFFARIYPRIRCKCMVPSLSPPLPCPWWANSRRLPVFLAPDHLLPRRCSRNLPLSL